MAKLTITVTINEIMIAGPKPRDTREYMRYAVSMYNAPCARFITLATPFIKEKPIDIKQYSPPRINPLIMISSIKIATLFLITFNTFSLLDLPLIQWINPRRKSESGAASSMISWE